MRCLRLNEDNGVTLGIICSQLSGVIMTPRGEFLPEFRSLTALPKVTPMLDICLQGLCDFTKTQTGKFSWESSLSLENQP